MYDVTVVHSGAVAGADAAADADDVAGVRWCTPAIV